MFVCGGREGLCAMCIEHVHDTFSNQDSYRCLTNGFPTSTCQMGISSEEVQDFRTQHLVS